MAYLRRPNAIRHSPRSIAVLNTHDVNKAISNLKFEISVAVAVAIAPANAPGQSLPGARGGSVSGYRVNPDLKP
jgi:hypothetical protein